MKDPKAILEAIRSVTTELLGDALTGIYLHGSYAFGCFNPSRSDIDYLVVVNRPMTLDEKMSYITEILKLNEKALPKGIEMSVVLEKDCQSFVYPTPYDLHFSNDHLERIKADLTEYCITMNGSDPDLAAHFTVTRSVGRVLYGKAIDEVFAPVPPEAYLDSIRSDVANAEADICANSIYVILNLCRVLAYIREGVILSKAQGGEWGIRNLPELYRPLIEEALSCYRSDRVYPADEHREALSAFADYMLSRIFIDNRE